MPSPLPPVDPGRPFRLVCLSPLPWGGQWTSRHELCRELAARGHPVVFVEPPENRLRTSREPVDRARTAPSGIDVVTPPPYLPYGVLGPVAPLANLVIDRNARSYAAFVAGTVPRDLPLVLLNSFMPVLGYRVAAALPVDVHAYHRADELRSFPSCRPRYLELERLVLADADLVACASEPVRDGIVADRPDAFVFRNGVDPTRFEGAVPDEQVAALPSPRAVLVGRVDHRMDPHLLRAAATVSTVVVAGDVVDRHDLPAGVVTLGQVPPSRVPALLAAADVALAPYADFPGDPLKIYEYLAAGLPVVASPAPGLRESPVAEHLVFADGPEGFAGAIAAAVRGRSASGDASRREAAAEQSWAKRVDELVARITAIAPGIGPR